MVLQDPCSQVLAFFLVCNDASAECDNNLPFLYGIL